MIRRQGNIARQGLVAGLAAGFVLFSGQGLANDTDTAPDPETQGPAYERLQLMAEILTIVESDYVEPVETSKLIEGALDGALSKLDPHSSYVPPVAFTEQQKAARREYGGLGIEVIMEDEGILVSYALEEGPAYGAGIRSGDYITAVEGESIVGKDLDEAVDGIRGLAGDPVNVTILSPASEPREVTVVREQVRGRAIRHRVEDGLGYIVIDTFNNEKLTDDLRHALNLLDTEIEGDLPGLIIDLRGNRGGLLTQSVSVAGLFLDGGEVLSVRGRDDIDTERYHAADGELYPDTPIVILVSPGSASAAEIVAGAIQDRGRGVVLGRRSFGKGSVQSVTPLPDNRGALRLTTQKYYTPSGQSIQGRGIMPDLLVAALDDTGELRDRFREDSLPNALTNDDKSTYEENYEDVIFPPEDFPVTEDFQLSQAIDVLKTDRYRTLLDAQSDLD
ncbi:S41 family peptidase [Algimonas porphyrae]|uniref:Peptidase S41 n=1 Tax=Algimonas porphyrae TaxID=1128113 RepID=A0ABQ5UVZ4_9PROT|nr:S41 family peptidase [Algimonas porphyrae]GLQ19272.1 peptidase S41 [Algimonas porphyrae]